jgi:hypothetical protein
MESERDDLLIALAQRCGGIETMLDSLFSFLKRKTDFYHIQLPGDKIGEYLQMMLCRKRCVICGAFSGFPEGKAESLVLKAYRKYLSDKVAPAPNKDAFKHAQRLNSHSGDLRDDEKSSETRDSKSVKLKQSNSPQSPVSDQCPQKDPLNTPVSGGTIQAEGPVLKQAQQKSDGNGFVCYNGGQSENYRWSQTIDEVILHIDVGGKLGQNLKGKDIDCRISRNHLRVGLKSLGSAPVIDGDLHDEVMVESWVRVIPLARRSAFFVRGGTDESNLL